MQVLKTTSPFTVAVSGAPKRMPSKTAPDSSARRPRISATRDLRGQQRHPFGVLVDHASARDGEQHLSPEGRAEQRRVPGPGVPLTCADRELRLRVEEGARGGLADAQTRLRDAGGRAENPV